MKLVHKLLYLVLILSLLSASCQLPIARQPAAKSGAGSPSAGQPGKTAVAGESTAAGQPAGEDDGEARIVKDAPAPSEIKLPDLGKITFQADTAHSTVATYPADGRAVTMTLTDAAGLTWTLTLPGNALDRRQNLRMTALTDLKGSDLLADLKGGVLLEPDGLTFFAPAALTVSGAGLSDKLVMLTGKHDGSAVTLALPGEEKSPASALLYHFSTALAADPVSEGQLTRLEQQMDQDEKALIEEVKQFLKNKDIRVPEPPSIPLECTDQDQEKKNDQALAGFYKAVYGPEGDLISRLLSLQRQSELVGRPSTQMMPLALRLLYRLEKKARLLIRTYTDQPEKLLVVSRVTLSIAHDIQLLGGDTALLEEIGQYCNRSVEKLFTELTEQHNFKKVEAIWTVYRWSALLGTQNKSVEDIRNRLEAALRFKFTGHLTVDFPEQEWKLESEFNLPYVNLLDGNGQRWEGSGPGSYLGYTGAASAPMKAPGFTVNATLTEFDVCAGTARLSVDRFFADSETYNPGEDKKEIDLPLVKNAFVALFRQYQGDKGYVFPVKINNGSPQVINESIPGKAPTSKVTGSLEVQIEHTPGK